MANPDLSTDRFWETPLPQLLHVLETAADGLTSEEGDQRLRRDGPNSLAKESRFAVLIAFLHFFANPLVLILLTASLISISLGDHVGGSIIIAIVMLSVLVNFYVEFQARHAVEDISKQVATTAEVLRDGKAREVPVAELVRGDIIKLNAGDLVPADCRLLEAKDLHVRESALTGESLPVVKAAGELPASKQGIADASNSIFLGTAVQTGIGTAVVVRTGRHTEFGRIAQRLSARPPMTEFSRGIRHFGAMITRVILLLVLFVLLVNIVLHRPLLEAFLFSVALAVGMTPEMMPMIITVTLAQGARQMAKKQVLVKQLSAIEDFGSVEILCSDKTGTLTEGEIVLDRHVDIYGQDNEDVLQYVYLNSYFEAGIKSPLDAAVMKHEHPSVNDFKKVDEIPFDFYRKRLSVVVSRSGEHLLISKGEAESVLEICAFVLTGGELKPFDSQLRATAMETFQRLSAEGYRTLGVAVKHVERQDSYSRDAEQEMALAGFAAFLDPPKKGIPTVLSELKENGISVVIMTGDNQFVTRKIVQDVGLPTDRIVTGNELDGMDDAALAYLAEHGAIFARVSPEQKSRVIRGLKSMGHVVAYLGDGINDAPSLYAADVGISVMNGVDVAKDAAKIILLENDLSVLNEGVMQGRRCFANVMKYIIMSTSSNFGNMFSMAAASLFLPFLPMLPTQILLNNFLYDLSQMAVPGDRVDASLLHTPKRWRISFIRQFMTIIGPISSLYDFLTFGVLLWLFHAFANPPLFRTGWFVESLATQTLVVFVIRTAGNPLTSRPSNPLLAGVLTISFTAAILPYTRVGALLGFTPMPLVLLAVIVLLSITYLVLVQVVKTWFYRRHALL
jgi:P-type Mg2+ transporter